VRGRRWIAIAQIVDARCVGHNVNLNLRRGRAPKGRPKHEAPFRCPAAEGVRGGKIPDCKWVIEEHPE
jgi:hypothetical protein